MRPLVLKTAPPRIDERASGFLALLLILLMLYVLKPAPSPPSAPLFPCGAPLYIQVEGEVGSPGVYPFCGQPRLDEVIRRAGGAGRSCELFDAQESERLRTGQTLLVIQYEPKCKAHLGEMWAYYKITLSIPLSVNKESQVGLTAIPGIGPNLAGAIVLAREKRGGFKTLDEISTVPGVGKALYRKIKPYLTL